MSCTVLFIQAFDSVGPSIVNMLNISLQTGIVLISFKHAIIEPVLKKSNLDPSDPKNYRPISKLSFVSKILEKTVAIQLTTFLETHELFDKFQSEFRKKHY